MAQAPTIVTTGDVPRAFEVPSRMDLPVDAEFTKALPKVELHAHLSGSIGRQCLHEIWKKRRQEDEDFELEDPLQVMPLEKVDYNIKTFFPLFSSYIYKLCSDLPSIQYSTRSVLQAFEDDGVAYLELRTTPRAIPSQGITTDIYVSTVLACIRDFEAQSIAPQDETPKPSLRTFLILSIDRRQTPAEALSTVDLALKYRNYRSAPGVVGLDLCGDPSKGDVSSFTPAFEKARAHHLPITPHFAEIAESGKQEELETLLSWKPARLGHVIHVPEYVRLELRKRKLGLELCLSCNVHAKMTEGGFQGHHFGYWRDKRCTIILCTDDLGVFGSPLSNEYLLAARHFNLSRTDLYTLAVSAVSKIFGPKDALKTFLTRAGAFWHQLDSSPASAAEFASTKGLVGDADDGSTAGKVDNPFEDEELIVCQ